MRLDKHEYFLGIAEAVARRSPCLNRQVGAILLDDNDRILSTGYNGPSAGVDHCKVCHRKESGRDLYACNAVHAEMNALLQCPGSYRIATAYITISPCMICARLLANTSCNLVVVGGLYTDDSWNEFMRFWERQLHRRYVFVPQKSIGEQYAKLYVKSKDQA